MHLVYLDETGDEHSIGYSALILPASRFRESLAIIKDFRRQLRTSDGILTTVELHANKFTSGRGRITGKNGRRVSQMRRCEIFEQLLLLVAGMPEVSLINGFRAGGSGEKPRLLERLLCRIHAAVESADSQALLFFDEGDNKRITTLARRLAVYNPVHSRLGAWADGSPYRNIPLLRIVEDPVFRSSRTSYLIQAVDFCAYALFQKETVNPSRAAFGLQHSLERYLRPICNTRAFAGDPLGIIR